MDNLTLRVREVNYMRDHKGLNEITNVIQKRYSLNDT